MDDFRDYTLVLAEKPDAAKRIASSLGRVKVVKDSATSIEFLISEGEIGQKYVVCSAVGHLYTVAPAFKERSIYPILDIEWVPIYVVEKTKKDIRRRIELISRLSKNAKELILACDYDLEGETIGYNILKYSAFTDGKKVFRAKFSTMTKEDLRKAFKNLILRTEWQLADAGRARHVLDFLWGVNLSRFLTESLRSIKGGYSILSVGRVQGPTLFNIFKREIEVRTFVTLPYWTIEAIAIKDGKEIPLTYTKKKILNRNEALELLKIKGKKGKVIKVTKTIQTIKPPTPYNLGDLQKDAYKVFGYSPRITLNIAERLYLDALISYPRTSSQKLPKDINYKKIFSKLSMHFSEIKKIIDIILARGEPRPMEGPKDDPAHPAIYPTGERPPKPLSGKEGRLYDLITRRFLATFMEPVKRQGISITIEVEGHKFKANGRRILESGWLLSFNKYVKYEEVELPYIKEGDEIEIKEIKIKEAYEDPPSRFNQASLLTWMEKENIGTKATRADIISTLYDRGYISGERIELTELGFSVVETLIGSVPKILSVGMTKEVENLLNSIEMGHVDSFTVIEMGAKQLLSVLKKLHRDFEKAGNSLYQGFLSSVRQKNIVGDCPICGVGKLTIIRSRKTGKRFIGCTNYKNGCRASAPIPARGLIKSTNRTCQSCGWPIVYVFFKGGRRPWSLCLNPKCPTKVKK